MDDISDIAAWYDHGVEDEDARLEMHQLEYDLTWRYLNRYLPPAGSILEIGAGTGRYTLALCKLGYSVTAVEPAISADDESYNNLQPLQRDLWLDLLLEVSSDETILGASRHLLYVGRKGGREADA